MIDTIVLKLHDLKKHEALRYRLTRINNGGSSVEVTHDANTIPLSMDADTGEIFPANVQLRQVSRETTYYDTGKRRLAGHWGDIHLPSHHYSIAFHIDTDKDFIYFNMSIPKIKFGTNVFQYIPHCYDKGFRFADNISFDSNILKSYTMLSSFIPNFFKKKFPNCPIDFSLLEVNRIDLCYNQIFNSKKEALSYLESVCHVKKKYQRGNGKVLANVHGSNFQFVTRTYSAKIYHKGSEFYKHDRTELSSIYKEQSKDLSIIQDLADRTLRYEMTFRNSFFCQEYNQFLFRKNCPIHKARKKFYKQAKKRHRLYHSEQKTLDHKFIFNKDKIGYTRVHKRFYKEFNKMLQKRHKFFFDSKSIFYEKTPLFLDIGYGLEWTCDYGRIKPSSSHLKCVDDFKLKPKNGTSFSYSLFKRLAVRLFNFINEMKLDSESDYTAMLKRLQNYNDGRTRGKLSPAKYKPIFRLLADGHSMDYIIDEIYEMPRTSSWRLRKNLKEKLGISPTGFTKFKFIWNGDYRRYHAWFYQYFRNFATLKI